MLLSWSSFLFVLACSDFLLLTFTLDFFFSILLPKLHPHDTQQITRMLLTLLPSVYEEYKKDTNSVAAWPASTARAAGCPLSLLTDGPATSGRLKGKERKVAKLKKLSKDSNKYIIPISKFVPLAEYVTSQKDSVIPVPACAISSLERAISARAGFATQLSHQQKP